jgi:pantothenate kinase
MIGIAGAPGAVKSTYAEALVTRTPDAVLVSMDGFHLADAVLDALGLRDRKGAPETFDAWGYAALLARLREETDRTVYAPSFERDLEQPIAGAVTIPPEVGTVVTEGNYLLLDQPAWLAARSCLDEVWFVHVDDDLRRRRLVDRHIAFGKSPTAARAWVARSDEANAALVEASRTRADRVVELTHWDPTTAPPG